MKNLVVFLSLISFCTSQTSIAQQFISNAPDFNGEVTKILPISGDCVLVFGDFDQIVTPPSNAIKLSNNQSESVYDGRITLMEYPVVESSAGIYQFMAKRVNLNEYWMYKVSLYTYNALTSVISRTSLPGEGRIFQLDKDYVYPIPEDGTLQRISLASLTEDTSWVGASLVSPNAFALHVSDSLMAYPRVSQNSFYFTVRDNITGTLLHQYAIPSIRADPYPHAPYSKLFSIGDSLFILPVNASRTESDVFVFDTSTTRSLITIQGLITDATLSNGELVITGDFQGYSDLIAVNPQNGNITDLNVDVSGEIKAIDTTASNLKLAGIFDSINGLPARNYAEIDLNGNVLYASPFSEVSQLYLREDLNGDSVFLGVNLKNEVGSVSSPVIYDASQNVIYPFIHTLSSEVIPVDINNGKLLYRFKNQVLDVAVLMDIQSGVSDTVAHDIGNYTLSHYRNNQVFFFQNRRYGNQIFAINSLTGDTLLYDHGNEEKIFDLEPMGDSLLVLCSTAIPSVYGDSVYLKSIDALTGELNGELYSRITASGDDVNAGVVNGSISIHGDSISFLYQESGNHLHSRSAMYIRPSGSNSWIEKSGFWDYDSDGYLVWFTDYLLTQSGAMVMNFKGVQGSVHLNRANWVLNNGSLPLNSEMNSSFADTVGGTFSIASATNNHMFIGGTPYGAAYSSGPRFGGRAFAVFTNPVIQGPPLAVEERIQQTAQAGNILYPNPASGVVRVKSGFQNAQIAVYAASGQLVLQANRAIELNLKDYPKGLYLIKATLPGGRESQQKLIIY